MRIMLQSLTPFQDQLEDAKAHLVDIHHIHKKDAPSGTAILLKNWAPFEMKVSSERTGDVVGTHALTLKLANETITLSHEAHSRKIFAEGAISVAREWSHRPLGDGLFTIENYFDQRKIL